jgi:hypothetical protein
MRFRGASMKRWSTVPFDTSVNVLQGWLLKQTHDRVLHNTLCSPTEHGASCEAHDPVASHDW